MTSMKYPCYEIYRDGSGQWRWRYWSANVKIIGVSSESYFNRSDCERSVDLMKASHSAPVYVPA